MKAASRRRWSIIFACWAGPPRKTARNCPLPEIIQLFDLPQILRHNARFDIAKLHWLDGEYLREMSDDRFRELGAEALRRAGYDLTKYAPEYIAAALATCKGKIKRFSELGPYAGFYFTTEIKVDPALAAKEFTPENKTRLNTLRNSFAQLEQFNAAGIEQTLKSTAKDLGVKVGILVHPTRLACTGSRSRPKPLSPAGNPRQKDRPGAPRCLVLELKHRWKWIKTNRAVR